MLLAVDDIHRCPPPPPPPLALRLHAMEMTIQAMMEMPITDDDRPTKERSGIVKVLSQKMCKLTKVGEIARKHLDVTSIIHIPRARVDI